MKKKGILVCLIIPVLAIITCCVVAVTKGRAIETIDGRKEKVEALVFAGKFSEALPLIDAIAAEKPTDHDIYDCYTICYEELKEYDTLFSYMDSQVEKYPNETYFQTSRMYLLFKLEQYDKAIEAADETFQRNLSIFEPYSLTMFGYEASDEKRKDAFYLCAYAKSIKSRTYFLQNKLADALRESQWIIPYISDSYIGYQSGLESYYLQHSIAWIEGRTSDAVEYAKKYIDLEAEAARKDKNDWDYNMYLSSQKDLNKITLLVKRWLAVHQ